MVVFILFLARIMHIFGQGGPNMPDFNKGKNAGVIAVSNSKAEYVRIADWQGKSLTFILADEILGKQKPTMPDNRKTRKEKKGFE
jgi:hypothetical protein